MIQARIRRLRNSVSVWFMKKVINIKLFYRGCQSRIIDDGLIIRSLDETKTFIYINKDHVTHALTFMKKSLLLLIINFLSNSTLRYSSYSRSYSSSYNCSNCSTYSLEWSNYCKYTSKYCSNSFRSIW